MIFLKKLYYGNYSLAKTYWLFYTLPYALFGIASYLMLANGIQREFVLVPTYIFYLYLVIVCIGIWRVANKSTSAWAVLAQISSAIMLVRALIGLLWIPLMYFAVFD